LSTHTNHTEYNETYFCTITCYKWLSIIQEANAYEAVYNWFAHLIKDGCQLCGYVIMPNHLHVLLFPTHPEKPLSKLVGEGKRFIAYDIVKRLKSLGKTELLNQLEEGVEAKEVANGKKHQVFRLSFDARICVDQKMIEQKLDYIHSNPVKGKWNLAGDYISYPHSSARFYEEGVNERGLLTHYKDVSIRVPFG